MKKKFKIIVKRDGMLSECYEEAEYQEEAIQQCLEKRKDWDWTNFKILNCEKVSTKNYSF